MRGVPFSISYLLYVYVPIYFLFFSIVMIETPQPREMVYADGFSEDKFSYIIKKNIGSPFKTLENAEDLEDYLKKIGQTRKNLEVVRLKPQNSRHIF